MLFSQFSAADNLRDLSDSNDRVVHGTSSVLPAMITLPLKCDPLAYDFTGKHRSLTSDVFTHIFRNRAERHDQLTSGFHQKVV